MQMYTCTCVYVHVLMVSETEQLTPLAHRILPCMQLIQIFMRRMINLREIAVQIIVCITQNLVFLAMRC